MPPALAEKRESVARATDPDGRLVRTARLDSQVITRAADDGGRIGFKGEAIVFNTPTWIGSKRWGFWEQIAPEAVTKTLREADVRFLQNHDPNRLLARSSAGSLRLSATAGGVDTDADMAPVSYANDVAVLLEGKELREMSFAFEPLAWEYEERDGEDMYTITELTLFDVAVVTYPAYTTTSAGLRSVAFDTLCRAAGLDAVASRRLIRDLTDTPDALLDVAPQRAVELLTQIATGQPDPGPAGDTSGPADTTRNDSPPADTTGASNKTALSHLAARTTQLMKEGL